MICVLIGRSGGGKSTIAGMLMADYGYERVPGTTTRPKRDNEPDDAYNFISDKKFREHLRNDDFVEFDSYGSHWYGTLKSSLAGDGKKVLAITPEGAANIKKASPDAFVVNVRTDMKTSVIRAINREEELTPDKMKRINDRACIDYFLFDSPECDFAVDNGDDADINDVARAIARAHEEHVKAFSGTEDI